MPQSLSSILVHLVFSTKNRTLWLTTDIEDELHKYMATVLRALDSPSLAINSTADHVHILFRLARTRTVAVWVQEVKSSTSKWLKTKGAAFAGFEWQRGYGAFSIGQSSVEALRRYIAGQNEHDRRKTFQDEFREFLTKYKIDYDERYVWDGSDSMSQSISPRWG